MAFEMDGLRVLRRLGKHAELFESVRPEATKAAHALVVRRLKVRGVALADARAVRNALGGEDFSLFLDAVSDADVRALLGRLDPRWPDLRSGKPHDLRSRLAALCDGGAEPEPKGTAGPAGKTAAPSAARRQPLRVMDISAMGATREAEPPAAETPAATPPKKGKKKGGGRKKKG